LRFQFGFSCGAIVTPEIFGGTVANFRQWNEDRFAAEIAACGLHEDVTAKVAAAHAAYRPENYSKISKIARRASQF